MLGSWHTTDNNSNNEGSSRLKTICPDFSSVNFNKRLKHKASYLEAEFINQWKLVLSVKKFRSYYKCGYVVCPPGYSILSKTMSTVGTPVRPLKIQKNFGTWQFLRPLSRKTRYLWHTQSYPQTCFGENAMGQLMTLHGEERRSRSTQSGTRGMSGPCCSQNQLREQGFSGLYSPAVIIALNLKTLKLRKLLKVEDQSLLKEWLPFHQPHAKQQF